VEKIWRLISPNVSNLSILIILLNNLFVSNEKNVVIFLHEAAVPILRHGDLKMNQSLAIENYLMSICERYKDMTKAQIAKDQQISAFKEDLLALVAGQLFGGADKEKNGKRSQPESRGKIGTPRRYFAC